MEYTVLLHYYTAFLFQHHTISLSPLNYFIPRNVTLVSLILMILLSIFLATSPPLSSSASTTALNALLHPCRKKLRPDWKSLDGALVNRCSCMFQIAIDSLTTVDHSVGSEPATPSAATVGGALLDPLDTALCR